MSNVLKSFLGHIARPSQSVLYNQNDIIAQVVLSIIQQQNNQHQPAQAQVQALPQTSSMANDNYYIMNSNLQHTPNSFRVQKKPLWIQREHFIMDAIEHSEWSQTDEQTSLLIGTQDHEVNYQYESSVNDGQTSKDLSSKYPFSKEGYTPQASNNHFNPHQTQDQINYIVPENSFKMQNPESHQEIKSSLSHSQEQNISQLYYANTADHENYYESCQEEAFDEFGNPSSSGAYDDFSIKRPKRNFNSKEEQSRYIEGFRTKYKTEMCKNWELTGFCFFQESCSFAHGMVELNIKPNVPKNYKTKLCKRFHEELYCPYGPRCQFKHQEEQGAALTPLDIQTKQVKNVKKQKKVVEQASPKHSSSLNLVGTIQVQQHQESAPNCVAVVDDQLKAIEDTLKQELNTEASQRSRKRLQIFEKITLTKSSKKKGKKAQRLVQ